MANEPAWAPLFEFVLHRTGVGAGTKLLDIGCGSGGALQIAKRLGAEVAGLDASSQLVEVARRRLSGSRIEIGDMEDLPFDASSFDVVTGINAFQFAGNVGRALSEAGRVCRSGGAVAMLVWGRREDCDLIIVTMPAVLAFLPPAQPGAAVGPVFSEPGVIEDLMVPAGLSPTDSGEIEMTLVFPDVETATRAILAAGPSSKAIGRVGEEAVARAVADTLGPVTRLDGSVVYNNRFRWVIAGPSR